MITRVCGGLLDCLDELNERSSVNEETPVEILSSHDDLSNKSCRPWVLGTIQLFSVDVDGCSLARVLGRLDEPARFQSASLFPSFLASIEAAGFHLLEDEELLR